MHGATIKVTYFLVEIKKFTGRQKRMPTTLSFIKLKYCKAI